MPKIYVVHYEEDPEAKVQFRLDSLCKWYDHICFTRNLIISTLAGLDDADTVFARLITNQEDIGAMIEPYYGEESATSLSDLLGIHNTIAREIIENYRDNTTTDAVDRAQSNVDDIATYLDSLDSVNWSKDAILQSFTGHVDYSIAEITARLDGDWVADITAYDEAHTSISEFADIFACGILNSFPEKFITYGDYTFPTMATQKKK